MTPLPRYRATALLLVAIAVCVDSSCYRAELDFGPLQDAAGGGLDGGSGGSPDVAGGEGSAEPPGGSRGDGGMRVVGGEGGVNPDQAGGGAGGVNPDQAGGGAGGVNPDQAGAAGAAGSAMHCDDTWVGTLDDEACRLGAFPTRAECADQPEGAWRGCYDGGCTVCTVKGLVAGYPYYFHWHPCCVPNDTCSNHTPGLCNGRCPPPTDHDRVPPCGALDPNPG